MTTAILTPKTPVCFREGILFKLNSLLVNLTDSFTSICKWRGHDPLTLLVLTACASRGPGISAIPSTPPGAQGKVQVRGGP